jgi:hypothetical protein
MLSVAQVLEMVPGDEQNATWINPGFRAVVADIKSTESRNGKPMHICTLRDTTGSAEISLTVWQPRVGFDKGDTIEVEGQGLRRTQYNGMAQATMGKATKIHVIGRAVTHNGSPQVKRALGEPDPQERAPAATGRDFHAQMGKIGLLYCHADAYARRAQDRCGNNWNPEELQACRSTIFIQACMRGLVDLAPALEAPKPAPAPAPKQPEPEDVPF